MVFFCFLAQKRRRLLIRLWIYNSSEDEMYTTALQATVSVPRIRAAALPNTARPT